MTSAKRAVGGATAPAKRRRQPEEVRARVIAAALTCFAKSGFDGTSVLQIARMAAVSVPLVIYHFQSKENLWQATVEEAVSQFEQRLDDLNADSALSATEKLRQIILALVQVHNEFPEFHRLMSQESHEVTHRLHWLCERFARRHLEAMTAIIRAAQAEGNVQPLAPERLSHAIVAMATITSQAAELQAISGHDLFSAEETQKTIDTINGLVFIRR